MAKKSKKSNVARRLEQLAQRQEQQNRLIRVGALLLVVVAVGLIAFLIWQNMRPETEQADVGGEEGVLLESERLAAELAPAERNGMYSEYPEFVIDLGKDYEAVIRTEKGDIRLDLFVPQAPQTVNSFVFLALEGFYDGVPFHRVLENFMAQGGDPTGFGSGGPGYQFNDETDSGLVFDRPGLLAMANSGPGTNGSQFFITFVPTPHLDGAHTIFGEVIEGMDVVDSLTQRDPSQSGTPADIIQRIDIYEIDA